MENNISLESNKSDYLTSLSKSLLGVIPFAGPFLSEIVTCTIPNQRVDRITKYIKILEGKLSNLESEVLDNAKVNPEFVGLLEESFIQATKSISEKRLEYISNIIHNGISNDDIILNQSKILLNLLTQLSDIEIIWLKYYSFRFSKKDYFEKHKNILEKERVYNSSDKELKNRSYMQESYIGNLTRLNLVEREYELDRKTKQPIFDNSKKSFKMKAPKTTGLGELLLEQIGLYEEEDYEGCCC